MLLWPFIYVCVFPKRGLEIVKWAESRSQRKENKLVLCVSVERNVIGVTWRTGPHCGRKAGVGRASIRSFCFSTKRSCWSQVLQTLSWERRTCSHLMCTHSLREELCLWSFVSGRFCVPETGKRALCLNRCSNNTCWSNGIKVWRACLYVQKAILYDEYVFITFNRCWIPHGFQKG